jgi:methyl-accepting chemotaxis protein
LNFNLRFKIILTAAFPLFFFFVIAVIYPLKQNLTSFNESNSLMSRVEVIKFASMVINETQKERGRSAGFLNGGIELSTLEKQRTINNKKIESLKKSLEESSFNKSYQAEIVKNLDSISEIRKLVTSKSISLSNALSSYTKIIKTLLNIETYVASNTGLNEISSQITNLRIIEDAKESGGKLRATMTGVFSKDLAIPNSKIAVINNLKAGVEENIKSSALKLDEESMSYVKKFTESSEWKSVNSNYSKILDNSKEGKYGIDPIDFFTRISNSLNLLNKIITHQKEVLIATTTEIKESSLRNLIIFCSLISAVLVSLMVLVFKMSNSISLNIFNIIRVFEKNISELGVSSTDISHSSSELNSSTTQQASFLQETVSSLDEINSMVQKNTESALSSTESSRESEEKALEGKKIIESMIQSINEIAQCNTEIMNEIRRNNEEMSHINNVINEIGDKTKIINDIVFQTKLLSFNASVEAARAGEHGKGFSVVAEEVGNLASMSGTASNEITELLEQSIDQVNRTIENSKLKFDSLIDTGQKKVNNGTLVASQCGDVLESIYENVNRVNSMITEIATASKEQSDGVREISNAMQDLDQVTHQNTLVAQKSSDTANSIKSSADQLEDAMSDLSSMLMGEKKAA